MRSDHLPLTRAKLQTRGFGHHFIYYPSIDSTNTVAGDLASTLPEGTVIIADEQTRGRGRLGRRWLAPPGTAILMSLILHPPAPIQPIHISALCSLAWLAALSDVAGLTATIKWPNDILMDGRKLGGILTEAIYQGAQLHAVIAGMGMNIHQEPAILAAAVDAHGGTAATSVDIERGGWTSRTDLLASFLLSAQNRYTDLLQQIREAAASDRPAQPLAALCHEWATYMSTIGSPVRVQMQEQNAMKIIEGIAVGVDSDGALLVEDIAGSRHKILAGDVTLR